MTDTIKRYGDSMCGEYEGIVEKVDGDYIKTSDLDRDKLETAIDALNESTDTFASESWQTAERKAAVKAINDAAIAHLTALLGVATQEK